MTATLARDIEWDYSPFVERQSPLVISVLTAAGLSPEKIDDLFVAAGAL